MVKYYKGICQESLSEGVARIEKEHEARYKKNTLIRQSGIFPLMPNSLNKFWLIYYSTRCKPFLYKIQEHQLS